MSDEALKFIVQYITSFELNINIWYKIVDSVGVFLPITVLSRVTYATEKLHQINVCHNNTKCLDPIQRISLAQDAVDDEDNLENGWQPRFRKF